MDIPPIIWEGLTKYIFHIIDQLPLPIRRKEEKKLKSLIRVASDTEIEIYDQKISAIRKNASAVPGPGGRRGHKFSATARKRMGMAQRKRWAKVKAKKKPAPKKITRKKKI